MARVWVALLLTTSVSLATTWRVPDDVATIQAAFDNVGEGDTVLVAAGVYHEALQAPGETFVLIGVFEPGGNPEKPMIDPSPLNGSTHLACLNLPFNSSVVIEGIDFRNGTEMFPRDNLSNVGGIINNADELVLRKCRFDSTYQTLYPNIGTLVVDTCEFLDNVNICIRDLSLSPTHIRYCTFRGLTESGLLLWVADNTVIENCSFQNEAGGEWIWGFGGGITIRNCDFGPTVAPAHAIIWLSGDASGWRFERNYFHDLVVTGPAITYSGPEVDTCYLVNNEFRRIQAAAQGGGAADLNGENIIAVENVFDSCQAYSAAGFGALKLGFSNGSLILRNRFLGPAFSGPAVRIAANSTARFRENSFETAGWAINANSAFLDAESNWWGDSTGPRHESNFGGLGDSISGPIDFTPWLTHHPLLTPDPTTHLLPLKMQVSAFPNPFNASANLSLSVGTPGMYAVTLYNTLGQRVKEVWSGALASEKSIAFNGESLPSGIYFVSLTSANDLGYGAIAKVVMLK